METLRKPAMKGDWNAMSAYADYLEERKGNQELIVGLRFCVRYRKFPKLSWKGVSLDVEDYYWHVTENKQAGNSITKGTNVLPICFENLAYPNYKSAHQAIKALGKTIIKINSIFKEIV